MRNGSAPQCRHDGKCAEWGEREGEGEEGKENERASERALTCELRRESPEVAREGETRPANCAEERDTEFNNRLSTRWSRLTGPNRECDGWSLKTHVLSQTESSYSF